MIPRRCDSRACRPAATLAALVVLALAGAVLAGQPPPAPPVYAARWTVALDSPLLPGAVASGGSLHVALRSGRVVTRALADGEPSWNADVGASAPLVVSGATLLVPADRALVALDTATGTQHWRRALDAPVSAAPSVGGATVHVPLDSGTLAVLNLADGAPMPTVPLGPASLTAVLVAGTRLIATAADGAVTALALADRRMLWQQRLGAPPTTLAATARDVIVSTGDGWLTGLNAANGHTRWRWRVNAGVVGVPLADESCVYYLALDNQLRALDRGNGHQQWKRALPIRPAFGPLRLDRWLLVAGLAPEVRVYRVADGTAAAAVPAPDELVAPPLLVPLDQDTLGLVLFVAGGRVQLLAPAPPAAAGRGAAAPPAPPKK